MKRAHPSDSDFAEPSRPRSPPGIPTRNEELFSTEDGRRKWLVDERESLRQSIINYADYEEYLCGMVEDQGKTVSSIPTGIHFALVRSLRQLVSNMPLLVQIYQGRKPISGPGMHELITVNDRPSLIFSSKSARRIRAS